MSTKTGNSIKAVIPVTGMTCASCVSQVEKTLNEVEGIASANVNLATEKATVEYDKTKVDIDEMVKDISDSGYGCYQDNRF